MKEGPEMCIVLRATWEVTSKSPTNETEPAFIVVFCSFIVVFCVLCFV
jgi:hypothetical protein